jgi:1-acyl-sn-glycerol-3-phosphate acyltransferase
MLAVTFFAYVLLATVFSIMAKNKPTNYQTWARRWSKNLMLLAKIRSTVKGLENIDPKKNYIIVCNHQGMADIPIVLAALPINFHFVIKAELFKIPIFNWYMTQADYIPVSRGSAASAYRSLMKINDLLLGGDSILFFPEGTRSKDGSLGIFKKGSLKVAYDTGVSVLPVALSGSYNLMKRGSLLLQPTKVSVNIGKPIHFEKTDEVSREQSDQDLEKVRSAIEKLIQER